MNRGEYEKRLRDGKPIESARELIFALADLQKARTTTNTPVWYLLNRLQRIVMDYADAHERGEGEPDHELLVLGLAALDLRVFDEQTRVRMLRYLAQRFAPSILAESAR